MKQIIRLTESDIHNIVKQVISEIGYRGAALTHGANYNAMKDKLNNRNINAARKMNTANDRILSAITLAVHDNFPNLTLPFIEKGGLNYYTVILHFNNVAYIDDKRFVLKGNLTISTNQKAVGCIEYNFCTGHFYRVIVMANGAIRRIKQIEKDPDGHQTFNELLTFISNYLYACEDYETNVNIKGSTPSKPH